MYAPALLLALPFLTGAAAAFLLPSPQIQETILAGAALLGLIAAVGSYALDNRSDSAVSIVVTAALAGLSLGVTDVRRVYRTPLASWFQATPSGTSVTLHGTLVEDASPTAAGASLLLDVAAIETAASLPVAIRGGVRLSVAGTLLE